MTEQAPLNLSVDELVLCARTFRGMADEAEKEACGCLAVGDRAGWERLKEVAATYRRYAVNTHPCLVDLTRLDRFQRADA